jgi:act minimal PKS acyl carrier protein
MTDFTVADLKDIMLKAADGTAPALDGDFLDTPFPELEFDSLAVLEIATLLQQNYHLVIPDEAVAELTSPRVVLDYVTARLSESE